MPKSYEDYDGNYMDIAFLPFLHVDSLPETLEPASIVLFVVASPSLYRT